MNEQAIIQRAAREANLIYGTFKQLENEMTNGADIPEHPPLAIAHVMHNISGALTDELTEIDNRKDFELALVRALSMAYMVGDSMRQRGNAVESLQGCLCFTIDDDEINKLLTQGES